MSNKIYIFTTFLLLGIVAWLMFGGGIGGGDSVNGGGAGNAIDEGSYQKVVLGMKNYNYYPNTVTVKAGKPVRIYLDSTVGGCYRSFVISAFNVRKTLRTPSDYVEFTPTQKGTYGFSCSMGMGRGTLVVE